MHDGNRIYRWNGTAWVSVQDQEIPFITGSLDTLSGSIVNINGKYGVSVRDGNRVVGFELNNGGNSSSFIIQADTFVITNRTTSGSIQPDGSGSKAPFIVENNLVFIDGAVINRIDAGIITAGIISAAIRIDTPQITASAILVKNGLGMRCEDDSSVLTLTGGSVDNDNNGGQIDLVGNDAASIGGIVQLIAGNVATGDILLKTGGDNQRLVAYNNGEIGVDDTIKRITPTDYTVNLSDGDNLIKFKWDDGLYANIDNGAAEFEIGSGGGGTDGTSGTSGQSGSSGTSGDSGSSGTSGDSGTSGTSGYDGTSGTSGDSGSSGTSGDSGSSGTSGDSGSSGTSGESCMYLPQPHLML